MKRYLIFGALGPLLGGFWLLLTTTVMSGYWSRPPSMAEAEKLFAVFAKTLQYSYLFGILPALIIGAVDDIVMHVRRIGPVLRMLIVGLLAFMAAELLYGSRGQDSGGLQFLLYGLVGFIPATVSSWLSRGIADRAAV
jgi:Zn-dependent protease with chaperone function